MEQPVIFDRAITGRSAWTRADVAEHDYRVTLTDAACTELLDVVRTMRQQPVPLLALRPDSFPMPACRSAMEDVRRVLTDGPRFALLSRCQWRSCRSTRPRRSTGCCRRCWPGPVAQ